MLVQENKNIPNKNIVPLGEIIKLNFPLKKPSSLTDIARTQNIDINILTQLNPAICNINTPIPKQVRIRIPKKLTSSNIKT